MFSNELGIVSEDKTTLEIKDSVDDKITFTKGKLGTLVIDSTHGHGQASFSVKQAEYIAKWILGVENV